MELTIDLFASALSNWILHPVIACTLASLIHAATRVTLAAHFATLYAIIAFSVYALKLLNIVLASSRIQKRAWRTEIVVITGGSQGLGSYLAAKIAEKGASVASIDRKEPTAMISGVKHYKCDLANGQELQETIALIQSRHGQPTILVNNAAIVHGKPIGKLKQEDLQNLFQINLFSPLRLVQLVLPAMRSQGYGYIVNIASTTAHISPKYLFDYAASKSGIICLHECLTAEMGGPSGPVKTLLVTLGQLSTTLFAGVETPSRFFGPVLDPANVADAIIQKIESGRGGVIAMPFYATYMPLFRVVPESLGRFARYLSKVDEGMNTFAESL